MMNQHCDYHIKLCLMGSQRVGKTSLQLRFTKNTFSEQWTSQAGVGFKNKTLESNCSIVKLYIWEENAPERYKSMIQRYYKGADGIVFIYDITNRQSFDQIRGLVEQANQCGALNVARILVGNKSDLQADREVRPEKGQELADMLGMTFLETSAKEAVNVEKVFTLLYKKAKLTGIVPKK